MRNHDPAGKMKEQESKETKERKGKQERGEKKKRIRKERKSRKEEPKSKGNIRKPRGKTERKHLALFPRGLGPSHLGPRATRFREGGAAPHGGCRHAPAPGAGDSAEAGDVPPGRRQAAHQPWTAQRRPTVTGLRRSPRPQCPITFPAETWHPVMKIAPSEGESQRVAASSPALRRRRGRGGARQRVASKPLAEPGGST